VIATALGPTSPRVIARARAARRPGLGPPRAHDHKRTATGVSCASAPACSRASRT